MPPEGLPRPEEMWSGAVADASDDSYPIIERTEEFEGRVWSVVRDRVGFGHHEATRDVIIHPGAVAIIAVDEEDRILLIRQYLLRCLLCLRNRIESSTQQLQMRNS